MLGPGRAEGSSGPGRRWTRGLSMCWRRWSGEGRPATRSPQTSTSPAREAAAALADLEALGYVTCSMVGVYSRTILQPPCWL